MTVTSALEQGPVATAQFLLSIEQPDGPAPEPERMARIMADVEALNEELRRSGAWVFTAGLAPAEQARVARSRPGGQPVGVSVTDGPYLEAREHLGGFWIIRAADLEAATGWAGRAAQATGLPVEVRAVAFSSLG